MSACGDDEVVGTTVTPSPTPTTAVTTLPVDSTTPDTATTTPTSATTTTVTLPYADLPAWTKLGGAAAEVVAGGDELFATNPDSGDIYRYLGSPMTWERVGGPGMTFAVDGEGTLYGLGVDGGAVFEWSGTGSEWDQIGGPAAWLFAGGDRLCALNPDTADVWCYSGD